jgi:Transposase DDE domain
VSRSGEVLCPLTGIRSPWYRKTADVHKLRWAIEMFIRWVKQALRIQKFLGASENAVRVQIAVALIAFPFRRSQLCVGKFCPHMY